jgi:hypothetical protein
MVDVFHRKLPGHTSIGNGAQHGIHGGLLGQVLGVSPGDFRSDTAQARIGKRQKPVKSIMVVRREPNIKCEAQSVSLCLTFERLSNIKEKSN